LTGADERREHKIIEHHGPTQQGQVLTFTLQSYVLFPESGMRNRIYHTICERKGNGEEGKELKSLRISITYIMILV